MEIENKRVKAKVSYDSVEDILYGRPAERGYRDSMMLDEFVFDFNDKKEVVGVEILNFAKLLNIPKYFVSNAKKGRVEIAITKENIRMNISLAAVLRNKERERYIDLERPNAYELTPSTLIAPITA